MSVKWNAANGELLLETAQNEDFDLLMTWFDSAGQPIDVTAMSAALQVRSGWNEPVAAVSLTDGSGITLGGVAGTIQIHIPKATNLGLVGNKYYVYDLVVGVKRLIHGTYFVSPGVSR